MTIRSRLTAAELNALATKAEIRQATFAGKGTFAALAYGRVRIGGKLLSHGYIGSDLVLLYEWCVGPIFAIETVYLNQAVAPAGVTMTHYLGTTTQGVDATMVAARAGYADKLVYTSPAGSVGIAYSVIRIPPSTIGGFPRAEAVIKARMTLDPRTGTVGWSENPALHALDVATDPVIGGGYVVTGAEALADRCDELLSGEARCRTGIVLSSPRRVLDHVDTLLEYAEGLRVWEGASLRFVADGKVAAPSRDYTADDMVEGSLDIRVAGLASAPTRIELRYTDPAAGPESWADAPAFAELPGVSDGSVGLVSSTVRMEGVNRYSEAARKALSRLRRLRLSGDYAWRAFDDGLRSQVGDVVRIVRPDVGLADRWVRVTKVGLVEAGRYSIKASDYSDLAYPDDVTPPSGTTTVPVGAITIMRAGELPVGWELFTAANGRYIVGASAAGGTYAVGATGGSEIVAIAGVTASAGEHTGNQFETKHGKTPSGGYEAGSGGDEAGAHTHNYGPTNAAITPAAQVYPLVRKTGAAGATVPYNLAVLAGEALLDPAVSELSAPNGRLLRAGAAVAASGSASQSVSVTYTTAGEHQHSTGWVGTKSGAAFSTREQFAAGGHNHAGSPGLTVTANVKRRRLALYGGSEDFEVAPGMIFMWSGSAGSVPAGWAWCDGTNDTPNLPSYYVEFSASAQAGTAKGNNKATWSGSTNTVGDHSHAGAETNYPPWDPYSTAHDDSAGAHSHTINGTADFTPSWYALGFIMFTGV